ncbi:MAG: hypothetical protein AB1601_00225 [Planctomycetota bacterium]
MSRIEGTVTAEETTIRSATRVGGLTRGSWISRPATTVAAGLAVLAVATLAGCRASPVGERRLAKRTSSLEHTAAVWGRTEVERPQRLAHTVGLADADLRGRVDRYRRAEQRAAEWLRRDAERWPQRQRLYWEETGRILGGHPERIECSAVTLFY